MFLTENNTKGISLMQINYTRFRPNIKGVKVKKSYILENTYHVEAERLDKRPTCCKRKMNIKDYRTVHIKDTNYGTKKVILHIKKQRYICPCCKRKETSKLDFVEVRHSISKNIQAETVQHLKKIKSFKQIGEDLGVSLSTMIRYFEKLEIPEINKSTETIHIDEFKGNADKEKYQLAVYNGERKLLTILKDRKAQTIKDYLNTLSEKPKKVVIDLFGPFRSVIRKTLPEAEIIADKYHYVRQMEWMISDVRINLHKEDERYKDLKKYWKLISKNPLELSIKQRKRLKELKNLNKTFSKCYGYKKEFYKLHKSETVEKFRAGLKKLIEKLLDSGIKECIKLGKTYKNWHEEIINSFKYKIDNGFVEGYNNKIKVIKRVSYGIKKFSTLKKLIQLKFLQYVDYFFDPTY